MQILNLKDSGVILIVSSLSSAWLLTNQNSDLHQGEAISKKKKCAHEVCSGDEDSNSDSEDELCQNIMDSESENSCYWKFLLLKILATE